MCRLRERKLDCCNTLDTYLEIVFTGSERLLALAQRQTFNRNMTEPAEKLGQGCPPYFALPGRICILGDLGTVKS